MTCKKCLVYIQQRDGERKERQDGESKPASKAVDERFIRWWYQPAKEHTREECDTELSERLFEVEDND